MRSTPLRILLVTLGLIAAGAVFGALAGVLTAVMGVSLTETPLNPIDRDELGFASFLGAFLGVVVFPITAWLFLRRVALGLAILGSVLGTILGGVLGWFLPLGDDPVDRAIWGGVVGFFCAALVMRVRVGRSAAYSQVAE